MPKTDERRVAEILHLVESGENTLEDLARALVAAQDRTVGLYRTLEGYLETAGKASGSLGSTVYAQRELVLKLEKVVNLLDDIVRRGQWLAIRDYIAEAIYQECVDQEREYLAGEFRAFVCTMEAPAELDALDRHWLWESSRQR